jgi:hypothetical protein
LSEEPETAYLSGKHDRLPADHETNAADRYRRSNEQKPMIGGVSVVIGKQSISKGAYLSQKEPA